MRFCRQRKASGATHACVCARDFEYLHTLCTVWPDGPMAQAYLASQNVVIAPEAAEEIRHAIEASIYLKTPIGDDQIRLLRRIETLRHVV